MPARPDPSPCAALDEAIARAERAGRAAWPGVEVDPGRFAAHVRRVRARPEDLEKAGADLFLACACAAGQPAALRLLESQVLPGIDPHLARLHLGGDGLDEVRQTVRVLLLAEPGMQIATYSARGRLAAWLRTLAIRVALRIKRRSDRQEGPPLSAALPQLLARDPDPEMNIIRGRDGRSFQSALDDSLAALAPRAKAVLRLHYVNDLDIDTIGALYQVHRSTVARWVAAARIFVVNSVREKLTAHRPPTSSEFESLTAALRSELHISVERLLASRDP